MAQQGQGFGVAESLDVLVNNLFTVEFALTTNARNLR